MADFCKQCSVETFGQDHKDLANLGGEEPLEEGYGYAAICEGCGYTLVDKDGRCIALDCPTHGETK